MLTVLTLLSALGCALVAGIFFAFSSFIMKALEKLPPAQGMAAMQSINVVIINPWFLLVFFGTAAACGCTAIGSLLRDDAPGAGYVLAGALLYLFGTVAVTMRFNVPRNNALAAVDPGSAEGVHEWSRYLPSWTAWNHVRTGAALAAAAMFIIAFALQRRGDFP